MENVSRRSLRHGITIVELLVVMGIIAILSALSIQVFRSTDARKALDEDTLRVVAELSEARSLTLASKNAMQYGVHFASSTVTLFESATYTAGSASSSISALNSRVNVSTVSLSGGGTDVVFQRLSGKTSQGGTITLSIIGNPALTRTVTIYQTGVSEFH